MKTINLSRVTLFGLLMSFLLLNEFCVIQLNARLKVQLFSRQNKIKKSPYSQQNEIDFQTFNPMDEIVDDNFAQVNSPPFVGNFICSNSIGILHLTRFQQSQLAKLFRTTTGQVHNTLVHLNGLFNKYVKPVGKHSVEVDQTLIDLIAQFSHSKSLKRKSSFSSVASVSSLIDQDNMDSDHTMSTPSSNELTPEASINAVNRYFDDNIPVISFPIVVGSFLFVVAFMVALCGGNSSGKWFRSERSLGKVGSYGLTVTRTPNQVSVAHVAQVPVSHFTIHSGQVSPDQSPVHTDPISNGGQSLLPLPQTTAFDSCDHAIEIPAESRSLDNFVHSSLDQLENRTGMRISEGDDAEIMKQALHIMCESSE